MKQLVVGLTVIGCLGLAGAAQADKLRVGVIDVEKIQSSKLGQQHRAEIEKMVKERQEKLGKEDKAVKDLNDKYEKDKLTLTDKQKEAKEQEIQQRLNALKKMVQDAQQQVRARETQIAGEADKVVGDIVNTIAKEDKRAIVIAKHQPGVFWVEEEVDITERVLKAYDAKAK